MIHVFDHVSASTTLRGDCGIQTPDRAGNQRPPHVGTLAQDPEETDDGSDSEGSSDPVTEAAPDYLEGLGDGDLTGAHLIQIIMGQLGTLWEEDRTALTGVLARSTVHEATEVLGGDHAIGRAGGDGAAEVLASMACQGPTLFRGSRTEASRSKGTHRHGRKCVDAGGRPQADGR